MSSRYKEANLSKVKPLSIVDRASKVSVGQIATPKTGVALADALPDLLQGRALRRAVAALRAAREEKREIVWLIGAHVIKCGLSLYLDSLMERGFITALATTGSATVHDTELAFFGKTSEDVAEELPRGRFGMARETADIFARACRLAGEEGMGLGEGIGAFVEREKAPHGSYSVFRAAYERGVPATVHVALGTDITHQHANFPAGLVGELSMKDFRILTASVANVFDRGAVVIFGSAVVLPEVFLKAVSIGYNLGRTPRDVTAVSFDMLPHYRVRENVLSRPFHGRGESFAFTGHHEIMLPLLHQLLVGS